MSMTDPLADMLTRIRNAIIARKAKVEVPASNLKERIAEILRDEGFLLSVERHEEGVQGALTLTLRYTDNESAIQEIHRVSRPGQRRYAAHDELPKIRSGLGVAILSTSRGVVSDRTARKLKVGGEILCEVW